MAEWLRRLTRNQLGLSRAGSSPVSVGLPIILTFSSCLSFFKMGINWYCCHPVPNFLLTLYTPQHHGWEVSYSPWWIIWACGVGGSYFRVHNATATHIIPSRVDGTILVSIVFCCKWHGWKEKGASERFSLVVESWWLGRNELSSWEFVKIRKNVRSMWVRLALATNLLLAHGD